MSPEEQQELKEYAKAIAKILYKNTDPKELNSLGSIEKAVRDRMQEHVMPELGVAWCNAQLGRDVLGAGRGTRLAGKLPRAAGSPDGRLLPSQLPRPQKLASGDPSSAEETVCLSTRLASLTYSAIASAFLSKISQAKVKDMKEN